MSENSHEEWFEKYFNDIENEHRDNKNSLLLYAPKAFGKTKWILILVFLILCCFIPYGLISWYEIEKYYWITNMLSNIGAGLIASLIILIFTVSKDKSENYILELAKYIKIKMEKLNKGYSSFFPHNQIAYQKKQYDLLYEYEKRFCDSCIVIIEFQQFLYDKMKKFYFCDRLKMDGIDLDELAMKSHEYFVNLSNLKNNGWKKIDGYDFEKNRLEISTKIDYVLILMSQFSEQIENLAFEMKYGTRKKTKYDDSLKKIEKEIVRVEKTNKN